VKKPDLSPRNPQYRFSTFSIGFDTVSWAPGRPYGLLKIEWWGAGAVICL